MFTGADKVIVAGRQLGISICRNIALSHADDGWVFRLDGDDVVDVEGWLELIIDPAFGAYSWHPTNLQLIDGRKTAHWFSSTRIWARHEPEENWTVPFQFHPGNMVVETSLMFRVGGWPAVAVNEDIGLCFAVSAECPGASIPACTLLYRAWPGQTVADVNYPTYKAEAFRVLELSVNARRAHDGMPPIKAPPPGGSSVPG